MSILLKGCNAAAFAISIFLMQASKNNQKEQSAAFDMVANPMGPAFAIWGLIFAWVLVFVAVQACSGVFDELLPALTPCFCASQLIQAIWIPIWNKANGEKADKGGDIWFWVASVVLLSTPLPHLKVCQVLADADPGTPYWVSYGMTINAAWVIMAAGLGVNMMAKVAGLKGAALSSVALCVLAGTVYLELNITGLIGNGLFGAYNSPTAFFSVATWALFWIFMNLKNIPAEDGAEESDHAKRILPLYGSTFIVFFKRLILLLILVCVGLEVMVCMRKE